MLLQQGKREHSIVIRPIVMVVAILLISLVSGLARADCLGKPDEADVRACKQSLRQDPADLDTRLSLAQALRGLKRYKEAIELLKQGQTYFPGDETSLQKLSMMQETIEWDERSSANTGTYANDAMTQVDLIKCTALQGKLALKACESVLSKHPNSTDALVGKGDALMNLSSSDVVDAIRVYRKALSIDSKKEGLSAKLAKAESKRKELGLRCMSANGSSGLDACNDALMEGSSDEADIQSRRGKLLLAVQRRDEAINAYKAALRLNPKNAEAQSELNRLTMVASPKPAVQEPIPKAIKKTEPATPPQALVYSNAPLMSGVTY